jgi:hypothetical protein
MAHYLLTGAGFSRNWGCWLADEVFEYLLAEPQLSTTIRTQLWQDRSAGGNYEDTITAFIGKQPEYDLLLSILAGMFHKMRNAYTGMGFQFEWSTNRQFQVHTFLQRFDAIFTLNQDTLLENHYLTQFLPTRPDNRWPDWDMPGLLHTRNATGTKNATAPKVIDGSGFMLRARSQLYLKLHGSHDWTTSSGSLLITGGNKETAIGDIPLLADYLRHFRTSICNEHTRLMIIGYGFGDGHINSILLEAAQAGAKFFVVDTAGVNVLYKQPHSGAVGQTLRDQMWPTVVGGSRRPLTSTFNNDRIEHDKLNSFFV